MCDQNDTRVNNKDLFALLLLKREDSWKGIQGLWQVVIMLEEDKERRFESII